MSKLNALFQEFHSIVNEAGALRSKAQKLYRDAEECSIGAQYMEQKLALKLEELKAEALAVESRNVPKPLKQILHKHTMTVTSSTPTLHDKSTLTLVAKGATPKVAKDSRTKKGASNAPDSVSSSTNDNLIAEPKVRNTDLTLKNEKALKLDPITGKETVEVSKPSVSPKASDATVAELRAQAASNVDTPSESATSPDATNEEPAIADNAKQFDSVQVTPKRNFAKKESRRLNAFSMFARECKQKNEHSDHKAIREAWKNLPADLQEVYRGKARDENLKDTREADNQTSEPLSVVVHVEAENKDKADDSKAMMTPPSIEDDVTRLPVAEEPLSAPVSPKGGRKRASTADTEASANVLTESNDANFSQAGLKKQKKSRANKLKQGAISKENHKGVANKAATESSIPAYPETKDAIDRLMSVDDDLINLLYKKN